MAIKIFAFMPLYKFMDGPAVQQFAGMILDIANKGDKLQIGFTQGMNVALARNQLFEHIATMPEDQWPDYILTLDSDHAYSATTLYSLIEKMEKHGLNNLAAPYRVRGSRELSMVKDGKNVFDSNLGTGVQECDCYGFGFNLFKPAFIKELKDKFKTLFKMEGDTYCGEDFYFCNLVRKAGYKCYYDADNIMGHYCLVLNK